jgi:lipopolysaccharide biosynthesis glycosyltransferase
MNIVLSTDNNFVQHCAVTMASILLNNRDVNFFILTADLTNDNRKILNDLAHKYNGAIDFLIVDSSILQKLPMPDGSFLNHVSIATYFRLFVASLLPECINKVIYLDCDIIVRNSLKELLDTDIDKYALAAVYQDDPNLINGDEYERLNIPSKYGYFNAGVLLINLRYWREYEVESKLLNYIYSNYSNIRFHDQDTLNGVLFAQTLCLSCKWNVLSYFLKNEIFHFTLSRCIEYKDELISGVGENPTVVHFVSRPKPWTWECVHPFKKDYYYYLQYTPFASWRPKVVLSKQVFKDKLKHFFPFYILPFVDKKGLYINFKNVVR